MFPSTEYEIVASHENSVHLPPHRVGTFSLENAQMVIDELKSLEFQILKVNVTCLKP